MASSRLDPRIVALLLAVEQGYDQRAWHGPNLKNVLRGVTPNEAAWRAQPERHNIWELAVHAAYWKYRVLRKLSADAPSSFDEPGSNFFERPTPGADISKTWDHDRQRLDEWHQRLIGAIGSFDSEQLDAVSYDRYTHRDLILGAAAHDVYHAGQIRLLRTMWAARS